MSELFSNTHIELFDSQISTWLAAMMKRDETIVAIDRDESVKYRWYVRMIGEEKEFTTIWITLGQRTLQYETYVMPAPEENALELYENVLRRNESLVGVHFSIGMEDAIFLRGEIPLGLLVENEFDRIMGTLYATVEKVFPTIIRIGFARHFAD